MNEELRFKVNLKGVIELLSKHIYKTKDVFLRELIQNSTDAITARKKFTTDFEPSINLELFDNGGTSTLTFVDNGIGLTEADIHKFIATIGQSSKKKELAPGEISDFIGHFGIGLLSCFMVSDKIVMISRHTNETQGYVWEGLPDGVYNIKKAESEVPVGTSVYLTSSEEGKEYFSFEKIEELLRYYGSLLPYKIYLKEGVREVCINETEPIWYSGFSEVDKAEVINYGNHLFKDNFLDAFPINSKVGGVKGVAYVLGRKSNASNKQLSHIYLKRMFLSETSKEIIPDWAFFIRVIVNADNLTPTASREEFYDDEILEQTRGEIGVALKKYLLGLPKFNPGLFSQFLNIHGLAIKALAVDDDELFQLLIPKLSFTTSLGMLTGEQLMRNFPAINYTSSIEEFRQSAPIFNSQNELLVNGGYVYDTELIQKIEDVFPKVNVQKSQSEDLINLMETPNIATQNRVEKIIDEVNRALRPFDCQAEFKLFSPMDLPTLISMEDNFGFFKEIKNAEEKSDDLFASIMGNFKEEFEAKATLCMNVNNSLVQKLLHIENPEEIKFITEMLYCQAMIMGHYPLKNGELQLLNGGIFKLLNLSFGIK